MFMKINYESVIIPAGNNFNMLSLTSMAVGRHVAFTFELC